MKCSGPRQCRKHTSLSGVSWYRPAAAIATPATSGPLASQAKKSPVGSFDRPEDAVRQTGHTTSRPRRSERGRSTAAPRRARVRSGHAARGFREDEQHRHDRGQHHRRHHRHPDADVPAQSAEVSARAASIPLHPLDSHDRRDQRCAEKQGRQYDRARHEAAQKALLSSLVNTRICHGWATIRPGFVICKMRTVGVDTR